MTLEYHYFVFSFAFTSETLHLMLGPVFELLKVLWAASITIWMISFLLNNNDAVCSNTE